MLLNYCQAWRCLALAAALALLSACGDGTDLSGLLSSSGGEADTSSSLSENYNLVASVQTNQIDLSWSSDSSASSYEIYRYTNSNCGSVPDSYTDCSDAKFWSVSGTTLSDSGLSANSIYYYRMRSRSSDATGDLSAQLEALTLPGTPTGFSARAEEGKPLLSWDEQNGTTYNLYRYSNQACDVSAIDLCTERRTWSLSDTSQLDSTADGGDLYYYQVEAVNNAGAGEISAQLSFLAPPDTPDYPSKFPLGDGSYSFDWDDVAGADYYELFRYTESECDGIPDNYQNCPDAFSFSIDAEDDGSSYIDYLPEEGITYYYKLSAANSSGRSELTDEFQAAIAVVLDQPVLDAPVPSGQSVSLSWEAVDKALSYQVYASLQADCFDIPDEPENCQGYTLFDSTSTSNEVTGTSATYSDLQVGSTYYFLVRAMLNGVTGPLSEEVNATTVPPTPQVPIASGGDREVSLIWDAVDGAQFYNLWAHSDASCLDTVISSQDIAANCGQYSLFDGLDVLEYTHVNLEHGTTYYYYLSAENAAGVSAISAPEVGTITQPAVPQLLAPESNTSAISLTWEGGAQGVDYYQLYRYTNQGCADDQVLSLNCDDGNVNWPQIDPALTSLVDTQADPGTLYYYRLAAVNSSGTVLSSEVSKALQLEAPQQLVVEAGGNQLKLGWAPVDGVEIYQLYRYSGDCPTLLTDGSVCTNYYATQLGAGSSEFVDVDLIAGTSYSYQLAASISGAADSELSAVVTDVPLLSAPANLSANSIVGGVELSFASVSGAESYLLYRYLISGCMVSESSVSTDCPDYQLITLDPAALNVSSDSLQYQDTGLLGGVNYSYRVVAANANVANSALSAEASATALLTQPVILSASGGYGSVTIEWGTVLGADSYTLYQYTADGSNCYPQNADVDPSLVCSNGYAEYPIAASDTNNEPDTNYSYTATDLDGDTTYGFRVQAQLSSFSPSELSDATILDVALPAPADLIATAGNNFIDLSWISVANAVSYHLVRSTSAGCLGFDDHSTCADFAEYDLAADTTAFTDAGLSAGTAYYYRVRAFAADSNPGAYSQEASAIPTLSAPENVRTVVGYGSIDLSWDAVAGAEQYTIYTYDQQPCANLLSTGSDCGDLRIETNSSVNSHTSKSLVGQRTYYFRVVAQRSEQDDSDPSAEVSAVPEVGVPFPSASAIEADITISWEAVAGVSEYSLHRSTGADCFVSVDSSEYSTSADLCPNYRVWEEIQDLSVSETVALGLTYYYATQSLDGDSVGAVSEPTSAVPLAVPSWSEVQGGYSEISLTWEIDSSGAESYSLYRSAEADCQQQLADWAQCQQGVIFSGIAAGTYTDSGLQEGTVYYYTLQANNYSGYATNPTVQSAVTAPAAPAALDLSFSELGVSVDWQAEQAGVDSFTLYRYINQDCSTILTDFLQCGVVEADTKFWLNAAPPLVDAAADLEPGTVYYYTLAAENTSGSTLSAEYSIVTGAEAPEIERVIGGYNSNEISWDPVLGATSYNLFRYTDSACAEADIAAESEACGAVKISDVSSPYTDPPSGSGVGASLASSAYYYYRLTSINESATSALSSARSGLTLPAAPSGLTAIGGDKSVTLEYSSSDSNLLSFIFSRDTTSECDLDDDAEICPNIQQLDGNQETTYVDSFNLESGTTYYYNAYAVNASGRSRPSSDAEAVTIPETPSNFTAVASSISQINLSWDRTAGAREYFITRYLDPACNTDDLDENLTACGSDDEQAATITVSDGPVSPGYADTVTPNTYYYYRIQASNDSGKSDYSSPALTALPSPSRPEGFAAVGGNEEVNLSWSPVANANGYYLYRYTDSGCSSYATDIDSCPGGLLQQLPSVSDTQQPLSFYTDTSGIDNSNEYYYRLQALNISGSSAVTDEIESLTYPANPDEVNISVTSERVSLAWSVQDHIDGYELYRYTNNQCASIPAAYEDCDDAIKYELSTNTRIDSGLDHGSTYYYKLLSYNSSGANISEQLVGVTAPEAPSDLVVTPIAGLNGGMNITWESDEVGVGSFSVYRYQPAGCMNTITLDSSTCDQDSLYTAHGIQARSFTDTNDLSTGEQYGYLVAAVSAQSEAYSLSPEASAYTYPAPPEITELEAETDEVTIHFADDQTGASSYYIYRYSGPADCVTAAGVISNCNDLAEYPGVAQSGVIDDDLDSGTLYYYRIASIGVAGTGYFSDEYTVTTLPAQPSTIELSVSVDGILVTWDNEQAGAESFILHRYRNSGCLALASDGSNCNDYLRLDTQAVGITDGQYTDTNLAYGYEYFYRLQASNESGAGALSDEFSTFTLPPAPPAPTLRGGTNQVQVNYERTTLSATSYRLYRYTVPACSDIGTNLFLSNCGQAYSIEDLQTGNANTVTDTNLNSGTTYYYVLTASNESGEGLPSEEVSATTVPDITTIDQTAGYQDYIEVEFDDEIESATSYTLYRYSVSGCVTTISGSCVDNETGEPITAVASPIADGGLEAGTRYYYAVTANNASGSSAYSAEASEITIPPAPSAPTVTGADGYMQIEFDDSVDGASNYKVYRYSSSNCITTLNDYANKQETCEAVTIDGTSSPIYDLELDAGQTLYYRLAAENESGSSPLSAQVTSITQPPAADLSTLNVSGDTASITLSWDDEQIGVDSYTVYHYDNSGCPDPDAQAGDEFSACVSLESNSDLSPVTFTSLEAGTTYYFIIQSTNASGNSFSDEFDLTTVPDKPDPVLLTGGNYQIEVDLPADEILGAEYFHLYRGEQSGCLSNNTIETCDTLVQLTDLDQSDSYALAHEAFPYIDAGLQPGVFYYYYLQAINDLGASLYSSQAVEQTAPSAPLAITLSPGHEQNTLQWQDPEGANTVHVYRYTNPGCDLLANGIGSCSDSLEQEFEVDAAATGTVTFTDTLLQAGATYYYALQASNDSGSELSAEYSSLTYPASPSIDSLTGGDRSIIIEFTDNIASALSYTIYRYTNSDDCITENIDDNTLNTNACSNLTILPADDQAPITASPYTDTELASGTEYYYQLVAHNQSGISLLSPSTDTITLPAMPEISLVPDIGSVTIDWDNNIIGNTDGTTLYRYADQTCINSLNNLFSCDSGASIWSNLQPGDGTGQPPITDTGLADNTEYYYVMQVGNSSGSLYSDELTALTYPAQPAAPEVIGGNRQITINWSSVTGATAYTIYYYTADACPSFPDCGSSNYTAVERSVNDATTLLVGNLNLGTTYYAHIEVFNGSGSSISAAASGSTLTDQPEFASLSGSNLRIDLSWTSPGSGVSGYELIRYETSGCMTAEGDLSACANSEIWDHGSIVSTVTSFIDVQSLEAAKRYYYRIGASNDSGTVWSEEASAVTAPEVIDPTVASGSEDITIGWTIPAGKEIDSVTIYSTSQFGCSNIPPDNSKTLCTNWTSWTDDTPTVDPLVVHKPDDADLKYYYYLEANNTSGSSFSSAFEGLVLAPAPEFTKLEGGDAKIDLAWDPVSNATYYTLYAYSQSCLSPDTAPADCGTDYYNVQDLTTNTISISNLGIGQRYYFRISVTNDAGTSALSDEVSVITLPATPQNLQAVGGSNSITLSWDAVTGADGYYIYQYTDPTCTDYIPSNYQNCPSGASSVSRAYVLDLTNTDTNLVAGDTYYYRLTASNDSGESTVASAQISAQPLFGSPDNLSATAIDSGGIYLSWIKVNGADSYEIYRYSYSNCITNRASYASGTCNDGDLTVLPVSGSNTQEYTDSTTAGGSTYYYRVSALDTELGEGELSDEASATARLQKPINLIATDGYGQVDLSWSAVDGADSYNLYRYSYSNCLTDDIDPATCQSRDSEYFKQDNVSTTEYTDTGMPGLQAYYYRVSASSNDSSTPDSAFSDEISAYVDLSSPQNVQATSGVLRIDISWEEVISADDSAQVSYLVYRYTNQCTDPHIDTLKIQCENWSSFPVNAGTFSYSDTSFTVGADDYQYRVQAVSGNSGGDISAQVSAQPQLPAPDNFNLTRGSTSLTLNWDPVDNADNYLIYRYTNERCYESGLNSTNCTDFFEGQTDTTTYSNTDLDPTQAYYYVIAAEKTDATDLGAYSAEVFGIPHLATPENFTAYSSGILEISVQWDAVPETDYYKIYYSTSPDCEFSGFESSASSSSCSSPYATQDVVAPDTSYVFTNLSEGDTYYYQVKAFNNANNYSTYSDRKSATAFETAGINTIIGGDQEINLTLTDFNQAAELIVYRFTDPDCTTEKLSIGAAACLAAGDEADDAAEWDDLSSIDLNDADLKSGKRYYYQLYTSATGEGDDQGAWSEQKSAMTWPAADVGTTLYHDDATTGDTQIVLSFAAPSNGEDYHYHFLRHTDPDCANYSTGTILNRADYTDWSALVDSTNALCSELQAVAINGATIHTPSGGSDELYFDTGLAEGTTYYYLLRTVNYSGTNGIDGVQLSGASATSNLLTWTTVPPAPTATDLSFGPATANSISLSFNAQLGAASYKLVRYIPANCPVSNAQISTVEACDTTAGYAEQDFNTPPNPSYDDTNLDPGIEYAYRYRAINAAGSSEYSPEFTDSTIPDTPVISLSASITAADANEITVSWAEADGVSYRRILASTDQSCLQNVVDGSEDIAECSNYVSTDSSAKVQAIISKHGNGSDGNTLIESGLNYYFSALAFNSSSEVSDYSAIASTTTAPPHPDSIQLTFGYQSVAVTWEQAANSTENIIYRYTDPACDPETAFDAATCGGNESDAIASYTNPAATFTDPNLLDNTQYYYTIRTSNVSGYRYTTRTDLTATTSAGIPPADSLAASGGEQEVNLTWGESPGATNYHLCFGSELSSDDISNALSEDGMDCSTGSDPSTIRSNGNATLTYNDVDSLEQGTTYYYWVRAETTGKSTSGADVTVLSPYNPTHAFATTLPATPGVSLVTDGTTITATFTEVKGADAYRIYRTTIEGCLGDANLSTAASSTNCGSGYSISEISQSSIDTFGASARSVAHPNLGNSNLYYYQVTAENTATSIYGTNQSRLSAAVSALTVPPAPVLTATSESNTSISVSWNDVTWNSVSNGDSYTVYASKDSDCNLLENSSDNCALQKTNIPADGTSLIEHTFTNLDSGTQHYFYAYATTYYGTTELTSLLSDEVSAYTMSSTIVISSRSIERDFGDYDVTFTWAADPTVTDYQLYLTKCNASNNSLSSCPAYTLQPTTNRSTGATEVTQILTLDSSSYYQAYLNVANPGVTNDQIDGVITFVTGPTAVSTSDITLSFDYDSSTYSQFELQVSAPDGFQVTDNDYWLIEYYSEIDPEDVMLLGEFDSSASFPLDLSATIPTSKTAYLVSTFTFTITAATEIDIYNSSEIDALTYRVETEDQLAKHPPLKLVHASNGTSTDDSSIMLSFYIDVDISGSYSMPSGYALTSAWAIIGNQRFNCLQGLTTLTEVDAICSAYASPDDQYDSYYEYYNAVNGANYFNATSYYKFGLSGIGANNTNAYTSAPYFMDIGKADELVDPDGDAPQITYPIRLMARKYKSPADGSTVSLLTSQEYFSTTDTEMLVYYYDAASSSAPTAPTLTLVPVPTFSSRSFTYQPETSLWSLDLTWLPEPSATNYYLHAYTDSTCPYLSTEPELCPSNQLQSTTPEFSFAYPDEQSGNYFYYRIQALDASANSSALGEQVAAHIPQPLNDSGITSCVESTTITGAQDCAHGRDSNFSTDLKAGIGSAGFDFTANSQCLYDHVTGLHWFLGTQASTWAETNLSTTPDPETNATTYPALSTATANLQAQAADLCGGSAWSLPSLHELLSIADYNQTGAKIDTQTLSEFNLSHSSYWSTSSHILDFATGEISLETNTSTPHNTMLVRGQRRWGTDFGADRFQMTQQTDTNTSLYLVYDTHTRLYYSPCLAGQSYDPITHTCLGLATELDYIDSLNSYPTTSAWRQPNIKELIAILDPANNLMPNPQFFPTYPEDTQIFTLTPSDQGTDYLLGRHLDLTTQSTQPTIFQLLTTHPIYANP